MTLIDAHTHLHDPKFDADRSAVFARMAAAGVCGAITIGTSIAESRDAVALAQKHKDIFATVGLHPHVFNGGPQPEGVAGREWDVQLGADVTEEIRLAALDTAIAELRMLAGDATKVVAVGEVGLDYFSHDPNALISDVQKQWQKAGFVAQILLAQELDLPVVVHGRGNTRTSMDAYEDIFALIAAHGNVRFVLHCYMGNAAMTQRFLALDNVVFSFAGNVTYAKKNKGGPLDGVLRMVPLSRMIVETDAPYLAPVPHRGARNESAYVADVCAYIARQKDISTGALAAATMQNTVQCFALEGKL